MEKLLSNKQKAVLAQLAARAYKQLQAYGCPVPSLEEWRHDETWKATGHTDSFTRATQKDYTLIYNRFAAYLGKEAIRDNTYTEMDKALHILRDSMQRYEIGPEYLAEVVRDQLHLPCTSKDVYGQLRKFAALEHVRNLNYTVINRGRPLPGRWRMKRAWKPTNRTPCRERSLREGWRIMWEPSECPGPSRTLAGEQLPSQPPNRKRPGDGVE